MAYTLTKILDKIDGLLDSDHEGLKTVFYNRVRYGDIPIEQADLKALQEMDLLSELGKPTNELMDDEAVAAYIEARLGGKPLPPEC